MMSADVFYTGSRIRLQFNLYNFFLINFLPTKTLINSFHRSTQINCNLANINPTQRTLEISFTHFIYLRYLPNTYLHTTKKTDEINCKKKYLTFHNFTANSSNHTTTHFIGTTNNNYQTNN